MAYTFLFDQMTIGDFRECITAAQSNDIARLLTVCDRIVVGGVYGLPITEMSNVVAQFGAAIVVYMRSPTIADDPNVTRLLNSALGDKD